MIKGKEAKRRFLEDDELFHYGMSLLGSELANISVTALLGLISGRWLEIIFFVLSFVSLRRYAGGYHCKTSRGCFWFSSFIMVIAVGGIVFLQTLMSRVEGVMPWICLWELVSGIIIIFMAPVEAANKPLDALEKKVYGKRAVITVVVQIVLALLLFLWQAGFGAVIVVTHSIIMATMLAEKCLKKIRKP